MQKMTNAATFVLMVAVVTGVSGCANQGGPAVIAQEVSTDTVHSSTDTVHDSTDTAKSDGDGG
jgi:hypothetical protein